MLVSKSIIFCFYSITTFLTLIMHFNKYIISLFSRNFSWNGQSKPIYVNLLYIKIKAYTHMLMNIFTLVCVCALERSACYWKRLKANKCRKLVVDLFFYFIYISLFGNWHFNENLQYIYLLNCQIKDNS